MVMVPIKPCSVDGLRMSSTGEMDNFTFRAMGDGREGGCAGDMRASILTVNGVIPSARKHKPVTLLSGDRRCDDMLEPVDILLGKTSGWAGGDAGLFGAWNAGFGEALGISVSAGFEFEPNSNVFRSGEWPNELDCCTLWKPNEYVGEWDANGVVEKRWSLTAGEDERVRRGSVGIDGRVPPGEYEWSVEDIGLTACPGEGGNSDWNSDGEKFGDVDVDDGVSISS
jgi:hypothetical protein